MSIPINLNVIKWWTTLSPTIRNITTLVFVALLSITVAQFLYTEKEKSNAELIKQLQNQIVIESNARIVAEGKLSDIEREFRIYLILDKRLTDSITATINNLKEDAK